MSSYVALTAATAYGQVLAARTLIERADLWRDGRSAGIEAGIRQRQAQIERALLAEIDAAHLPGAHGLLLVPGLRDDLQAFDADEGDRWRISAADPGDARTRTIAFTQPQPARD